YGVQMRRSQTRLLREYGLEQCNVPETRTLPDRSPISEREGYPRVLRHANAIFERTESASALLWLQSVGTSEKVNSIPNGGQIEHDHQESAQTHTQATMGRTAITEVVQVCLNWFQR